MRIFIAAELSEEIRNNIGKKISELKTSGAAVKWVEENNIHVTLKFLGWIKDEDPGRVEILAKKALSGQKKFKLNMEGLGTFPERRSPKVVWVGIKKGAEELKRAAISLEEEFSKNGFRKEERDFSPHATIGRVKESKGLKELKEFMEKEKGAKFGEMDVESIAIVKSTLSPKGPKYEVVKRIDLV